jgi:hypothetical protein
MEDNKVFLICSLTISLLVATIFIFAIYRSSVDGRYVACLRNQQVNCDGIIK